MEYKKSEEFKKRSAINKANAALKQYHHCMGRTGCAGVEPKLQKDEQDLLLKDVHQRHCIAPTGQSFGSTGMGEGWTQQQGSVYLRRNNLKHPSKTLEK